MRERVNVFCETLQQIPVPFKSYDIKKVEGMDNIYRVRFGDFRVVYHIDELQHKIYIVKMERRENVYKK
ncbi:Uncharacterised protein [uncultured archaeon]|nr:Uncharacterised protein [uncultured archaeon]